MEEGEIRQKLEEAGIEASDELISDFCKYINENQEAPKQEKAKAKPKPKKGKKSAKKAKKNEKPADLSEWEGRILNWEKKMYNLDKQLEACQNIRTQNTEEEEYDPALDPLNAYPRLSKRNTGRGYIKHPSTVSRPLFRFPIYKNEIYSRPPGFIYELRRNEENDFIPSTEKRHDDLRWRVKERITNTHPRYTPFVKSKNQNRKMNMLGEVM